MCQKRLKAAPFSNAIIKQGLSFNFYGDSLAARLKAELLPAIILTKRGVLNRETD